MLGRIVVFLFMATSTFFAAAPEGIPRDLARQRASQISDLRYNLRFTLGPHASTAPGEEEIRFQLKTAAPVLLDFRGGSTSNLKINGSAAPANIENGHIELPAKLLIAGENLVTLDFTAPVAPAGKAITRFEDKDDNSEYLYTLFVPMDASMAFPCFDQPDLKARFTLTVIAPQGWSVISNTSPEGVTGGLTLTTTKF